MGSQLTPLGVSSSFWSQTGYIVGKSICRLRRTPPVFGLAGKNVYSLFYGDDAHAYFRVPDVDRNLEAAAIYETKEFRKRRRADGWSLTNQFGAAVGKDDRWDVFKLEKRKLRRHELEQPGSGGRSRFSDNDDSFDASRANLLPRLMHAWSSETPDTLTSSDSARQRRRDKRRPCSSSSSSSFSFGSRDWFHDDDYEGDW